MDYSTFFVDSTEFEKPFNRQNTKQLEIPITQRDFVFVNYSKIDSGLSQRDDRFLGVITTVSSSRVFPSSPCRVAGIFFYPQDVDKYVDKNTRYWKKPLDIW